MPDIPEVNDEGQQTGASAQAAENVASNMNTDSRPLNNLGSSRQIPEENSNLQLPVRFEENMERQWPFGEVNPGRHPRIISVNPTRQVNAGTAPRGSLQSRASFVPEGAAALSPRYIATSADNRDTGESSHAQQAIPLLTTAQRPERVHRSLREEFEDYISHMAGQWVNARMGEIGTAGLSERELHRFRYPLEINNDMSRSENNRGSIENDRERARANSRRRLNEQRSRSREEIHETRRNLENPVEGFENRTERNRSSNPTERPTSININNNTYVPPPRRSSYEGNPSAGGRSVHFGAGTAMENAHLNDGILPGHDRNWRATYAPNIPPSDTENVANLQNYSQPMNPCNYQLGCTCPRCSREAMIGQMLENNMRQLGLGNAESNVPGYYQPPPVHDPRQATGYPIIPPSIPHQNIFVPTPGFSVHNPHFNMGTNQFVPTVPTSVPAMAPPYATMFNPVPPMYTTSTPVFPRRDPEADRFLQKSVELPKYCGHADKKTPYDFLVEMEKYRNVTGISYDVLLERVKVALTDVAYSWYEKQQMWNPFTSWDNFKRRFRDNFQPPDYKKLLFRELTYRCQGAHESLSEFLRVISGYYERLDIHDETMIISKVLEDLHPTYSNFFLSNKHFRNLAEFSAAVQEADRTVQLGKCYREPPANASIEPSLGYRPNVSSKIGYSYSERDTTSAASLPRVDRERQNGIYSSSNRERRFSGTSEQVTNQATGHLAPESKDASDNRQIGLPSQAPTPVPQSNNNFSPTRSRSPSPGRNFSGCHHCGGPHFRRDCPTAPKSPAPASPDPLNSKGLGFQKRQ